MSRRGTRFVAACVLGAGLAAAACEETKPHELAPAASALASALPAAPKAVPFAIDAASSKVAFSMQAPIEKISGDAPASLSGELFVDLEELTRSTGLVKVDLDKLILYQERRSDENAAFGERVKNDRQNEHARTWLEISPDVPAPERERNRFVEFRVTKIEHASEANVPAGSGADRTVRAEIVGELRLHGRKNEQRAKVELTFHFEGGEVRSLGVKTLAPLPIGLEEYDVRPREAFGKLAQKTLGALGSKVAESAPVEIEFTARRK